MKIAEPAVPLLMWFLIIGAGAYSAQAQIQESDFGRSDPPSLFDFSIHWTPGSSTETHQADDLLRFLEGFSGIPSISAQTRVVGAELELIESLDDSLLFTFPGGASPSFEVGDLIIGDPANPYFRQVRNIIPQVGALQVETGTASLAEAVTQGYLKTELVPGASDTKSAKNDGAGLVWEGVRTFQREFLNAEVSGNLRLDPRIAIETAFDQGLEFFRMETFGGIEYDLVFGLAMDLLKVAEVDRSPIEWEIARWEEVFIQTIGPVPVWERVVVRVTATIEFEGDARGEARLPFSGQSQLRLGAEYDRNLPSDRRWRILGEAGGGPAGEHPILTLEGELIGWFHLRPEIMVRFYDEPGPMLSLRETVAFEGFGAPPPHVFCEWEAGSETERILDFDLRALDSMVEVWRSTPTTPLTALGNGTCQAPASEVPELVEIEAGTFTMGRRDDGDDRLVGSADETPRRSVTLSNYRIGKYEVTNAQFVGVLNWALGEGLLEGSEGEDYQAGNVYTEGRLLLRIDSEEGPIRLSGSFFTVGDREGVPLADHPVVQVTWDGAVAYCNWLSLIEELPPCYDTATSGRWTLANRFGGGYRLPTEAEWERAAAWDGSKHWIYGFERDALTGRDRCNYWDGVGYVNPMGFSGPPYTAPVGWFNGVNVSPNGGIQTLISRSPAGCFDMSGNVMEWCEDHYLSTYYSTPGSRDENPLSQVSPTGTRVVRGGSWTNTASTSRTANREHLIPTSGNDALGFRVAQSVFETTGGPAMAVIPAGAFTMGNAGSPREAVCDCSDCGCELPTRTVQIDYPLLVGRTEITNEEYAQVLNWANAAGRLEAADGSPHVQGDVFLNGRFLIDVTSAYADILHQGGAFAPRVRSGVSMALHPVKRVSWYGAAAFCNWLSEMNGLRPAYDPINWRLINRKNQGFRLPSEAEWEYVCRGSVTNPNRYLPFSFGDDALLDLSSCDPSAVLDAHMVWCGNSNLWTEAVGTRAANDLGLQDLHGNVREWCEDEWHGGYSGEGRPNDGRAWISPSSGSRVIRGGGWIDTPANCRSASRMAVSPDFRSSALGFRVVRLR